MVWGVISSSGYLEFQSPSMPMNRTDYITVLSCSLLFPTGQCQNSDRV